MQARPLPGHRLTPSLSRARGRRRYIRRAARQEARKSARTSSNSDSVCRRARIPTHTPSANVDMRVRRPGRANEAGPQPSPTARSARRRFAGGPFVPPGGSQLYVHPRPPPRSWAHTGAHNARATEPCSPPDLRWGRAPARCSPLLRCREFASA